MNPLPSRWRRAGRTALIAATLATTATLASATLVPVTPAHAQAGCVTAMYQVTVWSGGFSATVTIANQCADPVDGWSLALTLPPGHGITSAWNADWAGTSGPITANPLSWNRVVHPGTSWVIGFVGSWTTAYRSPLACTINGDACRPSPNPRPPTASLTSPASSVATFMPGCPFRFAASALDPDGAVDRVEFYVNNLLLGTDRSAPYSLPVTRDAMPPPSPAGAFWVGRARAIDDGVPARSGDSASVTFEIAIGTTVPESLLACTGSQTMPAGTSEPIAFGLSSTVASQVTLSVIGDPRITVTPTTVPRNGNAILATVTAAPGSSGATAVIVASSGTVIPAAMVVIVT